MLKVLLRNRINAVAGFTFIIAILVSPGCGNAGTGDVTTDTTSQKDTLRRPVITEGGIKDTIPIGVDHSTASDSANK